MVAPSPDLVYLTGYGPMPLERLTVLVIRPDGDAVLVVPELERQLALDSAAGQTLEPEQVDRLARRGRPLRAGLLDAPARGTGGDRGPDVGVARAGAAADGPEHRVRARLADHRPAPRREGCRRARGAATGRPRRRRGVPADLRHAIPGQAGGGDRGGPGGAAPGARALPRRLHDRRVRARTPRRRITSPAAGRSCREGRRRHGLRRRGRRLLLRHHAHRGGGGAAGGVRGGLPARAGGAGRRRADRPTRRHRAGRRPRRAADHRRRRATASGSSTGPATGSAWRSTSRRTSSRGTRRC